MNKIPTRSTNPSYKPGWIFLIIAVVVELVGRLITGAMTNSARNLAFGDYVYRMNQITTMEMAVDLISVVLFVISIVLFVRAFLVSRAAKKA